MILSRNLSEAFNAQVNAEMWSSNLYLSMSVYFQKAGLNGFAHWMKKQAAEELEHATPWIVAAILRSARSTWFRQAGEIRWRYSSMFTNTSAMYQS